MRLDGDHFVVLFPEIEQELMDMVQDTSENTSFLKKDTVFAYMVFKLKSGVFKLLKEKSSSSPSPSSGNG